MCGVVLLTLPAVAVFLRALLLDQVIGQPVDRLPAWFQSLQQVGIARVDATDPTVSFTSVSFERDATLFALPYAAGFPQALVYLALAGALAAALAALAAALMSTAAILSEDVVHGLQPEMAPDSARIATTRVALLGAAFVTAWLAIAAPADPLKLFLWSLNFSASAVISGACAVDLVEAHQCLGCDGGHAGRPRDGGAGHPARRSRRMAACRARWQAPSDFPPGPRRPWSPACCRRRRHGRA